MKQKVATVERIMWSSPHVMEISSSSHHDACRQSGDGSKPAMFALRYMLVMYTLLGEAS
jgi:hypothetical protein